MLKEILEVKALTHIFLTGEGITLHPNRPYHIIDHLPIIV